MRTTIPNHGDYFRITNKYDLNYGQVGQVLYLDEDSNGLKRVQFTLNPLGGGPKKQRSIPLGYFRILDPLEVLAESGR